MNNTNQESSPTFLFISVHPLLYLLPVNSGIVSFYYYFPSEVNLLHTSVGSMRFQDKTVRSENAKYAYEEGDTIGVMLDFVLEKIFYFKNAQWIHTQAMLFNTLWPVAHCHVGHSSIKICGRSENYPLPEEPSYEFMK